MLCAPEIAALAERTTMTAVATKDFYIARPQIDDKTTFNTNCPVGESTLVLGCYNKSKIYLLQIDRPELKAVMDVTAAHEMLHSAYADLSNKERRQVDAWIEEFYSTLNDPKLQQIMAEYDKTEPGERLNELHSILGTQVALLSPELDNYYKRYFADRQKIVAAYKAYEGIFEALESQINGLRTSAESLKNQITITEQEIAAAKNELEATNARMDQLLDQGRISEYNGLVPTQNVQVSYYNSLVDTDQDLIEQYNAKVDQLNTLALEQNQLVDSLDSTKFTPIDQ